MRATSRLTRLLSPASKLVNIEKCFGRRIGEILGEEEKQDALTRCLLAHLFVLHTRQYPRLIDNTCELAFQDTLLTLYLPFCIPEGFLVTCVQGF